ncbi:zinc finger domain-containing protein [Streptomyces sp. NPDC003857]
MNPTEAAELLGHAAAFDNRQPSAAAAMAWAAALHDVPLDNDAKAAVASYYTTAPQDPKERLWILPHHVRTLRSKLRSARLENFQYEPVGDETVPEYLARLRGQVQAIASGRVPAPTGMPALEGGPSKDFMRELEARGWQGNRTVPDSDNEAAETELLETVRRSGPLGIECPTCQAAIGKPCKSPGGSASQPLGKPRSKPHSARMRAASGETEATAEQRRDEEQRIREMSRRALERDEVVDAEIVEEAS